LCKKNMVKIKLITSYLDNPAGSIYETDKEKADQLISLGRAELVKRVYKTKVVTPRTNKKYRTK